MPRGRTNPVLVTRVRRDDDGGAPDRRRRPAKVLVEEPMEIRLDEHLVTTTMRTPGHDYELAVGFLLTEGLLAGQSVSEVRYCATGSAVETGFNVVSVSTGGRAPTPPAAPVPTDDLDALADRHPPPAAPASPFDLDVVLGVAEAVRTRQELRTLTGAAWAAAAFDPSAGAVHVLREDGVVRNAVAKVVGRLHLDGNLGSRPPLGLFVSAAVDLDVVRMAWAAGFGVVAGAGGATSLAVEAARRAGITLAGFVGDGAADLYT